MFLRLPPEIRNIIYHLILFRPKQPVRLVPRKKQRSTRILLACKHIHNEAWLFFYRHNHFILHGTWHLYKYLHSVNSARRHQIRRLTIERV